MSVSIKGSKPIEKNFEFELTESRGQIHIICNDKVIGWILPNGTLEVCIPAAGMPIGDDGLWKVIRWA